MAINPNLHDDWVKGTSWSFGPLVALWSNVCLYPEHEHPGYTIHTPCQRLLTAISVTDRW